MKISTKYYLLILLNLFSLFTYAQETIIPAKPSLKEQTAVYDYANLLSDTERNVLTEKLLKYHDSTSTQIVIVSISSLKGYDIADIAVKWAHSWGIGQEKEDNGLFILISKNDRKIDIETGYGIEYLLTDGLAKRVIDRVIVPEFKKGSYYKGLDKGTNVIIDILAGEYKNTNPKSESEANFPWAFIIFIIIWIIIIILAKSNKNKPNSNNRKGGRSISDDIFRSIIFSSGGSSGGFGGSSGGGSFGSGGFGGGFGGGGFGGGGASGSW